MTKTTTQDSTGRDYYLILDYDAPDERWIKLSPIELLAKAEVLIDLSIKFRIASEERSSK